MVPDTKMIRIEFTDDGECLVHFDGMRIAKREDGEWGSLKKGYTVTSPSFGNLCLL
jgi:hypothetical protein